LYHSSDYLEGLDYGYGYNRTGKNKNKQINYTKAKLAFKRAIKAYEKGGKNYLYRDDIKSYFYLGLFYEYGYGVKKDLKKAFDLYSKGAKLGEQSAMFGLAEIYRWGKGTKQDVQKAVIWFKKAIKQGSLSSMANLGKIYSRGEGNVKMNKITAYKYWSRCAKSTEDNSIAIEYCQNQLSYMCKENSWACR
jgi:TPR repeat protein